MPRVLKSLTLMLVLVSPLYGARKVKHQVTNEMHQVEVLFSKLNKSVQEKYISKMRGLKELLVFHEDFRIQQEKFNSRVALLEKQSAKRVTFLNENDIDDIESDEVLKKINEELSFITTITNRRLIEAWDFFKNNSPELSDQMLLGFEKERVFATVFATTLLFLSRGLKDLTESDKNALNLIMDMGRVPSSKIERPELRKFSYRAIKKVPHVDLVIFLMSGAFVANEIEVLD